jgi:hypothetical protein
MDVLPADAGYSRKRTLRILKWAVVSIVAILATSVAISIGHHFAFEKLSPRERRLAIYDAFCSRIKQHYFDPGFSGVDWNQIDGQWRRFNASVSARVRRNMKSNPPIRYIRAVIPFAPQLF